MPTTYLQIYFILNSLKLMDINVLNKIASRDNPMSSMYNFFCEIYNYILLIKLYLNMKSP